MKIKNITLKEEVFSDDYYGWWWSTNPKYRNIPVGRMQHETEAQNFLKAHKIAFNSEDHKNDAYTNMFKLDFVRIIVNPNRQTKKYFIAVEGPPGPLKSIEDDIIDTYDHYGTQIDELTIETFGEKRKHVTVGSYASYATRQIRKFLSSI